MEIIPNWHPVLVHFSVGLLITSAILHLTVLFVNSDTHKQTITAVANWNLWIGTVFAILTVAAGVYAFNTVNHDTPSHLVMLEHRKLAVVTTVGFIAVAVWSFLRAKNAAPIQWSLTLAVMVVSGLLLSTAWHGGELVYRHGLGVMSLPNPDKHAHAAGEQHDHGDEIHGDSGHTGQVPEGKGHESLDQEKQSHQEQGHEEHAHEHGDSHSHDDNIDAGKSVTPVTEPSHDDHFHGEPVEEKPQQPEVKNNTQSHDGHEHHDHSH